MADPINIGIIGCGRIMPAHLRGYKVLQEHGYDDFRITALCARRLEDAERFRKRGEGPPPRPPVTTDTSDPRGTSAETSGAEGLRDLAASFSILESAELNQSVKVDDVESGKIAAYQKEINDYYGL